MAISFGLVTTVIVFLFLKGEEPYLARELPMLIRSCLCFLALSGVSGVCLYGALKALRWQKSAQVAMWLGVVLVGYVYWPK